MLTLIIDSRVGKCCESCVLLPLIEITRNFTQRYQDKPANLVLSSSIFSHFKPINKTNTGGGASFDTELIASLQTQNLDLIKCQQCRQSLYALDFFFFPA